MGERASYQCGEIVDRPLIEPSLRIALAFTLVFGFAGLVYHLAGLDASGILFYLSIGAITVLLTALTTRWSISRHYGAKLVPKGELPRVDRILDDLSSRFGVRRPRLMFISSEEPNAFTFGFGRRTYVGVTRSLLSALDDQQLRAVMAHEFAHIWSRDNVTQTLGVAVKKTLHALTVLLAIAIILAGMIIAAVLLSASGSKSKRASRGLMIVPLGMALGVCILSPITIGASQCLFSRRCEFRADERSARVTGRPEDLAHALTVIDKYPRQGLAANKHGVYSSLWISSNACPGLLERLLSSHPPVEERVRRLMKMAHGGCECLAAPSMARFGIPPKPAHSGPWRERCSDVVNSAPVRETEHEPVVRGPRPRGPMESSSRRYDGVREPVPSIIDGIVTYERPDRHTYSMR